MDHPRPYTPPKYQHNDTAARDYLNRKGYVVFRNIASPAEIEKAISLWWDLVEGNSNLKRNDPSTWHEWVADPSVGIMSGYSIGQSQFMWFVRTIPKLREAFALVWEDEDLLVSFDGCGVFRPPEYNPKWMTYGGWYHADQNCFKKPGRHSIQGLLNLYPSGPHDGGIVVVPASPPMVEAAFQKYRELSIGGDFVRFRHEFDYWQDPLKAITTRTDENRYDLLPVKIVLDPGDFIMWDSRTIHCNHPLLNSIMMIPMSFIVLNALLLMFV